MNTYKLILLLHLLSLQGGSVTAPIFLLILYYMNITNWNVYGKSFCQGLAGVAGSGMEGGEEGRNMNPFPGFDE